MSCIPHQAVDGRALVHHLHTWLAPVRMQWLLNPPKYRWTLPSVDQESLATGTTSNEALHKELNAAFDAVHEMHRPTLVLRLRMFWLYKMFPHSKALYGNGIRARKQHLVLARSINSLQPFSVNEWKGWCSEVAMRNAGSQPLAAMREQHAGQLRSHKASELRRRPSAAWSSASSILKRPAASLVNQVKADRKAGRAPGPRKRTAFSRKGEGVHRDLAKAFVARHHANS